MKKLIVMTMVLAAMQSGTFAMVGPKESKLPKPLGQSYEATVPDTLDLAHRAELALHGITGTVDPDNDYLMWFRVFCFANPPYMKHGGAADIECTPKFYDGLTMLRNICGSSEYLDIEQGMDTAMLSWLNKGDGLYDAVYSPKRPWHMAYYPGVKTKKEDYASLVGSGIMLTAMVLRNDLGLESYEDEIRAMVRGLDKAAVKKDDYAYYPEGDSGHQFSFLRSVGGWKETSEAQSFDDGPEGSSTFYQAYQMRGLAMWAARTGDKQALELAGKLARYVMKPRFWGHPSDPPHVLGKEQGHVDSHFHARAAVLRGLLEYGIVAGDTKVCDFVRSSYEYMRTYGINRIGFIPCWTHTGDNYMEGCLLGDLLALTVKMSRAGIGDYWDDADRIIRNQLAEAQFTDRDLLKRVSQQAAKSKPEGYPGQISTENVHERMLGTFATWIMPTYLYNHLNQCCTGNASRGIAYAWDGILNGQGDDVQVNLLLNRASKWVDVDSYLPYEGKVVIRNKTAKRVSVRIPVWVDRNKLKASVNGMARDLSWVGAYAVFGDMKPSDTLQLDFPVTEETVHLTAKTNTDKKIAENKEHMTAQSEADKESEQYTTYAITFRGNTVVDISPRNESPSVYPTYLRDHMKTGKKAPMKNKTRFVSEKPVNW